MADREDNQNERTGGGYDDPSLSIPPERIRERAKNNSAYVIRLIIAIDKFL